MSRISLLCAITWTAMRPATRILYSLARSRSGAARAKRGKKTRATSPGFRGDIKGGACGWFCVIGLVIICSDVRGRAQQGGRGQASPAAQPPPRTETVQEYPREQVESGRTRFAAQCAFCHGRDAAGGEGGPDLTRSTLVATDVRGDKILPVVRSGRSDKGMPAFTLPDADLTAIVAFIHDQKTQADNATGGRRAVDIADLQSGDVTAGKRYFDGACARCHSASGDLAGIATRLDGLPLLQRMLNPASGGRGNASPRAVPTVRVTTGPGETVTGKLAYRDEFTIAITDDAGWYRSWPTGGVQITIDDPLRAHVDQLSKYTDRDMHDVLAYLQTLR